MQTQSYCQLMLNRLQSVSVSVSPLFKHCKPKFRFNNLHENSQLYYCFQWEIVINCTYEVLRTSVASIKIRGITGLELYFFRYWHNTYYCISQLVRALWLVNLAVRSLLYGPLKFKAVFVAKMFRDLSPSVVTFLASKSLNLSFTSKIVY